MDAVALTAGQRSDLLLLVALLEVERRHVLAGVHLAVADLDVVELLGDLLPDVVVGIERVARLVDVGQVDGLAELDLARIGLLEAGQQLEQRRLAGAVRPDHADHAAGRQREAQVLEQQLVAEALRQTLGLDHRVAEPRAGGDRDPGLVETLGGLLLHQLVEVVQTRLLLGLATLRVLARPVELLVDPALAGLVGALLLRHPLGLLVEPAGVVALERVAAATVELEDPARDVVQEVAIVGDRDDRALVGLQVALQPGDRLGVEVVGRLVEQQQVGGREQQAGERDAALLAAGEVGDGPVAGRAAQRVHRVLDLGVEVPGVGGVDLGLQAGELGGGLVAVVHRQLVEPVDERLHLAEAVHHVLVDRLGLVEVGLLLEDPDGRVGRQGRLAVEVLVGPRHDPQQARLAGAVDPEHADLGPGQERQREVLEDRLLRRMHLRQLVHREDVLRRHASDGTETRRKRP